jgi:hypothetical protein
MSLSFESSTVYNAMIVKQSLKPVHRIAYSAFSNAVPDSASMEVSIALDCTVLTEVSSAVPNAVCSAMSRPVLLECLVRGSVQ